MGRDAGQPPHEGTGNAAKKLKEAAVDCANGTDRPPHELEIYWYCKRFQALPDNGGVMDQDARLMYLMSVLDNIYNVVTHYHSLSGHNIHKLTDGERMILRSIIKDGLPI